MKRFCVIVVALLLCAGMSYPVLAQGEATVLFLMINPGARQGGMGEAGVALANDASAVYWNPAGLAFQKDEQQKNNKYAVTLMHVNWLPQFNLSDLYYDYFAGRAHLEGIGTVGISVQFMNYGDNVQTDTEGNVLGTFSSNEFAFTGSYALKVKDNLGLGVNLKFVYSRLSPVEVGTERSKGIGTTFAVDIGALYHPGFARRLSVGFNLSNLGPKVVYIDKEQADPIPLNLRLGFAYRLVDSEFNKLTLVYDMNRLMVPRDVKKRKDSFITYLWSSWSDGADAFKRITHSVGAEYWYSNLIALRAGYFYEHPDFGGRKFATFGGGVRISFFGVDFSYILASVDDHPLSDTIRFSLSGWF